MLLHIKSREDVMINLTAATLRKDDARLCQAPLRRAPVRRTELLEPQRPLLAATFGLTCELFLDVRVLDKAGDKTDFLNIHT